MASITSLSGSTSSSSSIYGTRNVLSGLASGMDTDALIENAISGYKTKITQLQQKKTKIEWQQDSFRSVIDKLNSFADKYTSFQSSTNLMSASFFNNSTSVTTSGTYADKIIASGKTSSNIQVLGVKQLAKAATYTATGIGGTAGKITGETVDLGDTRELSNISGSLTLKYGSDRSFTLKFAETDVYNSVSELASAMESKLAEQDMTLSDGSTVKADTRIGVRVNGDSIEFYDKTDAGNNVYAYAASGKMAEAISADFSEKPESLDFSGITLSTTQNSSEYLAGKELNFTLDGVTKKITIPDDAAYSNGAEFVSMIQDKLDSAFGSGKIKLAETGSETDMSFSLEMSVATGSTLSVSGSAAPLVGLGNTATSYVNTSKTLGELLGEDAWDGTFPIEADGEVTLVPATGDAEAYYKDSKGNKVAMGADGRYYQVDSKNEFMFEMKINDVVVGSFSKNSSLESVLNAINGNADVGVTVNFSKTTNQFKFTAKETGAASAVKMDADNLAGKLFGATDTRNGQDAVLSVSVNGELLDGITRSTNSFEIDGMTMTLKGAFGDYSETTDDEGAVSYSMTDINAAMEDAVSFKSSADVDKIYNAIKSMVEDFNTMASEIKKAYSTMPQQKSSGDDYEPLTDEDMEGMSESAIAKYEEKAKTGILFGDRDLSNLYSQLVKSVSMSGSDASALKAIGINVNYSNGLTTLSIDENTLKSTLESSPDKVKDLFTKSTSNGSSSNGLMQSLKNTIDSYAKTTGATKGMLIQKAGSSLVPTSLLQNTLQTQLDNLDTQISKWQEKMSDQVDRYTTQFTRLEQLISQMNSQSSMLSGLSGGY